jgi:hypothetical protein
MTQPTKHWFGAHGMQLSTAMPRRRFRDDFGVDQWVENTATQRHARLGSRSTFALRSDFCLGGNGKSSAHRARRRPNLPLRGVKTGRSMSSGFSPSRRGLPARQLERDGPISGYGALRGGDAPRGDCIRHAAVSLEELRLRREGLGTTGNDEERAIAAPVTLHNVLCFVDGPNDKARETQSLPKESRHTTIGPHSCHDDVCVLRHDGEHKIRCRYARSRRQMARRVKGVRAIQSC